jgi:hypothetical protein
VSVGHRGGTGVVGLAGEVELVIVESGDATIV